MILRKRSCTFFAGIVLSGLACTNARAEVGKAFPIPGSAVQPAIPALLRAFSDHEVVAMSAGHGDKDGDDFILSLVRNPAFARSVNDIAVECGNSLYQPMLDRYIAGDDISFEQVRDVWRNTTQKMCSTSAFYEQFFPLIRAINLRLPRAVRLRVLACDPPIDWSLVKTEQEYNAFVTSRDDSIASVMEREVLSKHRKALMLFGEMHLFHGANRGVGKYELRYPGVTLVVMGLSEYESSLADANQSALSNFMPPALIRAQGTVLGGLGLGSFFPPSIDISTECVVDTDFPNDVQRPMGEMVDAFLYLAPQPLRLSERLPADIAVDLTYEAELQRRGQISGQTFDPDSWKELVFYDAAHPLRDHPRPINKEAMREDCLTEKAHKTH